jgi:hypothetical protein
VTGPAGTNGHDAETRQHDSDGNGPSAMRAVPRGERAPLLASRRT